MKGLISLTWCFLYKNDSSEKIIIVQATNPKISYLDTEKS